MYPATVHLLTAFFALCHRLALTEDDESVLGSEGGSLSPTLWRATVALLAEADRGAPGTRVDIGFAPLLLRWLGVGDEAGFVETYGLEPADAFERDRGALGPLAEAIESGAGSEAVRDLVSHAWALRAVRLTGELPDTARLVVEAIDRAIEGCPWSPSRRRSLFEVMAAASEAAGDWTRAQAARRWIERLDKEDAFSYIAAEVVLILWCVTHDGLLLASECGLESGIDASPAGWAGVRAALEAGRIEDVPAPTRTFAAWSWGDGLEESVLRIALGEHAPMLADMARAVELLFEGGVGLDALSFDAVRVVANALVRRRNQVEGGFEPLPGERRSPFHEAHQGVRRPETMERVALLRGLREALERCAGFDPVAAAQAHMDRAFECGCRGEHEETRAHLVKAREQACQLPHDPARRDLPEVHLAEWRWRSGEPGEARCVAKALSGPKASELVRRIEAREPGRAAVRRAERAVRRRGDLASRCDLARAHLAAGHAIAGERMANELCRSHPGEPLAWATLAELLAATGRNRDAVAPAREALARGGAGARGRMLLARVLSAIGPEGREESAALAVQLIEAHREREQLRSDDLAEAVRIAHDGGADLRICRRGDDEVWALRANDEAPEEWLGAAVARRCDGVWAPDAPEWLARLGEVAADEPAELARWVVERIEALQHIRLLIARSVFGPVNGLEAEATVYERARERLTECQRRCIQEEGLAVTARAAVSLGVGEPGPDVKVGLAGHWQQSLPAIDAGLGMEVALRLRASEIAQRAFFVGAGADERERLVQLHTVEQERVEWIRWVGAGNRLCHFADGCGGGCSIATGTRLEPVLALSRSEDDDRVRVAVWATRWHEAARR